MGVKHGIGYDTFIDQGVAGNYIRGVLAEVVVEDVVVGTVGNRSADVADGEGDGRDGGNELVRTADLSNDGCGNYHAADAEGRESH